MLVIPLSFFPIILQNKLEKLSLRFGGSRHVKHRIWASVSLSVSVHIHSWNKRSTRLMWEVEEAYVSDVHLLFFLLPVSLPLR